MGVFYIDYETGEFATHAQLRAAGLVDPVDHQPARPWFAVNAPIDANTLWHAVMRKRDDTGIYLGTLTFRHGDHYDLLVSQGWEEIPVELVGASVVAGPITPAPSPFE